MGLGAWDLGRRPCSRGGPSGWFAGGRRRLLRLQRGAATSSRHRAPSPVPSQGPCAALDSAPPVEPPERTSKHRKMQQGLRGVWLKRRRVGPAWQVGSQDQIHQRPRRVRRGDLQGVGYCGREDSPLGAPTSDPFQPRSPAQNPGSGTSGRGLTLRLFDLGPGVA